MGTGVNDNSRDTQPPDETVSAVIGVPVNRAKAYILQMFLENQREIQQHYLSSQLVLATVERDFVDELRSLFVSTGLRGAVLTYDVVKPYNSVSKAWNIACGREAIRKYVLSETEASYLLCMDVDMTYDPTVVGTLVKNIRGHDAIFSGYWLRDNHGIALTGGGCCMLDRHALARLTFRCVEFKGGKAILDDSLLELDLFRLECRAKKGFFVSISHYENKTQARHMHPQRVGIAMRMVNSSVVRYALIRASLILHINLPWRLKMLFNRLHGPLSD